MTAIIGWIFDLISIWIGLKPDPKIALGQSQELQKIQKENHDVSQEIRAEQSKLDSDPAAVDSLLKPPADRKS